MKKLVFVFILFSTVAFSQNINNYKAVIIPLKYDFLKSENQYRLATLTKLNLQKAGFVAFYSNEDIPSEYKDRCSLLTVDVKKESGFLMTKLAVVFNDCFGKLVFQSEMGKSKLKEYESAYSEALNDAFRSINALNYKYELSQLPIQQVTQVIPVAVVNSPISSSATVVQDSPNTNAELLYAQATPTGYQLVDASPKVIFKLNKTSSPTFFTASKGSIQGVFIQKDNEWFFEYYENEKLFSELVRVKF
ncbi:hypothetical protein [Flavobacterium ammonificans]|uniref:Uncharacterized protein n=1 Tax=Flavobacterium ammonificans TaxID=1751056 RepID=A0ABM7V2G6_9FLAO|nr:hypothetical protein [Flavobacterium ammonificans]BDB52637.1 hypothetical protein GENT11_09490 [Flavobacterium ammonificans]